MVRIDLMSVTRQMGDEGISFFSGYTRIPETTQYS